MIKIKIVPLILILGLIGCKSASKPIDYLGQVHPDTIPIIFAPDIVSIKGRFEHGISFSPDSQELAFGILNKDDSGEIFYAKKENKHWTKPKIFEPLKNKSVYLPYFSPNGKFLLYAQSKSNTNAYITNIGIIEKTNGNWHSPQIIQSPLNSSSREANASMTNDGTIYFSSNRNCDGKENCFTADLFYSKPMGNAYKNVAVISELMSPNDEESVFISPNEEYLIFCRYTDDKNGTDLYISYRDIDKNWLAPTILDTTINSEYWDRRPFVSIDNKFLFFTQLQIEETGVIESDIFWVNTTKLFKPFVYHPLSDITVQVGKQFEIVIPADYFKDINDNLLSLNLHQNKLDWLKFDAEKMKLSGLPSTDGDFELIFSAVDTSNNTTKDKVNLKVIR